MPRPRQRPGSAITVATYAELDRFVRAFALGHFHLLMIIGAPGLQKSRTVREAVGGNVCWVEGHATAFRVYCELYAHRDELVVIDDVDSLYGDRSAVRLLKCLCQTEECKTVAWQSNAPALDREGIPRSFTTTSRAAIIANDWKTLNENVEAVEDRGLILLFEPHPLEVHLRTATWFWDSEVFDFIGGQLHLIPRPSMRYYRLAWDLKRAGMDWRGTLLGRWLTGTALHVARLKADGSYASEEDRARVFVEKGIGCRATYFNHAKKLRPQVEVPRLNLTGHSPIPVEQNPESVGVTPLHRGRDGNA